MTASQVKKALEAHIRPASAEFLPQFFKTGKGEYGEGDQFIGVRVPQTRAVCKQFAQLPLPEVQKLFDSPIHEHRLAAGFILNYQYPKSPDKKAIYELYLANVLAVRVNNWDIVDTTAPGVLGRYLWDTNGNRDVLYKLARSKNLWQKRTGLLASWYFFTSKGGDDFTTTLELCEILLHDPHDLIQKAVGWMLREIGKRVDRKILLDFLNKHAATMPRTTLRYAIEHLPESQRLYYLQRRLASKDVQSK